MGRYDRLRKERRHQIMLCRPGRDLGAGVAARTSPEAFFRWAQRLRPRVGAADPDGRIGRAGVHGVYRRAADPPGPGGADTY